MSPDNEWNASKFSCCSPVVGGDKLLYFDLFTRDRLCQTIFILLSSQLSTNWTEKERKCFLFGGLVIRKVRFQARRETELRLSEFVKFCNEKKEGKALRTVMMRRDCTRAGLEKWQSSPGADARNLFSTECEWKARWKRMKNVMYESRNFLSWGKTFCILFLAHFLWRKAVLYESHSRILSTPLSWCLDRIKTRASSTQFDCHLHLHFSLVPLAWDTINFCFCFTEIMTQK